MSEFKKRSFFTLSSWHITINTNSKDPAKYHAFNEAIDEWLSNLLDFMIPSSACFMHKNPKMARVNDDGVLVGAFHFDRSLVGSIEEEQRSVEFGSQKGLLHAHIMVNCVHTTWCSLDRCKSQLFIKQKAGLKGCYMKLKNWNNEGWLMRNYGLKGWGYTKHINKEK